MNLVDGRGRALDEVTIRLSQDEVTELLLAAAQLDGGEQDHALVRSQDGTTVAIYRDTGSPTPLERSTDWWVGLLVLVAITFVVVGAYTIARGLLSLFF